LAFSSGAGAGARAAVGTGVMGGMTAATLLAIFFVPLFYRLIDRSKQGGRHHADEEEAVHDSSEQTKTNPNGGKHD